MIVGSIDVKCYGGSGLTPGMDDSWKFITNEKEHDVVAQEICDHLNRYDGEYEHLLNLTARFPDRQVKIERYYMWDGKEDNEFAAAMGNAFVEYLWGLQDVVSILQHTPVELQICWLEKADKSKPWS